MLEPDTRTIVRLATRTFFISLFSFDLSTSTLFLFSVSLWRSFVTTELVSLSRIKESARTLVVLDVDG